MADDLGPLPKFDQQDTLQQKSILAFEQALPVELFLFRDERVDDKGVDGALEVKADGRFTNCRAQVQLKSTESSKAENSDGSFSVSIATSNLNYLLNGSSPLYVLWLSQSNELRFEWARDAWETLYAANPHWEANETFTIRFLKKLSNENLILIRERILNEARMQRRIHESLLRSAPSETVVVNITSEGLQTSDPELAFATLMSSGMTIVSSGYGRRVYEFYQLINPNRVNHPRVRLVVAYAASSMGRYQEAKSHLAIASLASDEEKLSIEDALFLEHIAVVADYNLGRVSLEVYLEKLNQIMFQLPRTRRLEHELTILRHKLLSNDDYPVRLVILEDMRKLVSEIVSNEDSIDPHRIQAKLVLLDAQADELSMQFIEDIGRMHIRYKLGSSLFEIYQQLELRFRSWLQTLEAVLSEARAAKHPLLIAHAMSIVVKFHVCVLVNAVVMSSDEHTDCGSELDWLADYALQCIQIFKQAGNVLWECRTKMLLADYYEACDEPLKARALATEVLPIARAFEYMQVAQSASEHLDGKSMLRLLLSHRSQRPTDDEIALSQSDIDVQRISKLTLREMDLPIERLPLVEKDFFLGRYIAEQRRDWCRHIELEQDLTHLQSPATKYLNDPERFGLCTKFMHRSTFGHNDFEFIVGLFKRMYCDSCTDRAPRSKCQTERDASNPPIRPDES